MLIEKAYLQEVLVAFKGTSLVLMDLIKLFRKYFHQTLYYIDHRIFILKRYYILNDKYLTFDLDAGQNKSVIPFYF